MSKNFKKLWPVLLGALILYLIGMGWGLPSTERAERVLAPEQRTDAFYKSLEDNRRAMYQRIGLNIEWRSEVVSLCYYGGRRPLRGKHAAAKPDAGGKERRRA